MAGSAEFQAAASRVKQLKVEPGKTNLLKLYGWYKLVTVGDLDPVKEPKPGIFNDPEVRAKWEARKAIIGTTPADAEEEYIKLVGELFGDVSE